MAEDHRFMTYTRLEKAYRRILARRMPGRLKRRTLQTQYRVTAETTSVNAWIGERRSDSLTALRHMTLEGRAQDRPVRHHSLTLERTIA